MFNFSKIRKIIQGETRRNKIHLDVMKGLGYGMPRIRKTLVDCNDVDLVKLAANGRVAHSTLYSTLKGTQANQEAMTLIAESLGLDRQELFPE